MFKRNFPLIVLFFIFLGLLDIIWQIPTYKKNSFDDSQMLEISSSKYFRGRMDMPSLEEIYVLENTANRDISSLEKFIQGRAAGLHWLSGEYFRKNKKTGDIQLRLHLEIDSLGIFHCKEILFLNQKDTTLENKLIEHIEYFWRYKKSISGKTDFWIPLRWKAKYKK